MKFALLYMKILYDKKGKPTMTKMNEEKMMRLKQINNVQLELLKSNVMEAIRHLKNSKAGRVDGVPTEFLKSLGQEAIEDHKITKSKRSASHIKNKEISKICVAVSEDFVQ